MRGSKPKSFAGLVGLTIGISHSSVNHLKACRALGPLQGARAKVNYIDHIGLGLALTEARKLRKRESFLKSI